jgi:hypothetical protein
MRCLLGPAFGSLVALAAGPDEDSASLAHRWQLFEDRSWSIVSDATEDPAATDIAEGTAGRCMPGMVEVAGSMKIGFVEALQDQTCTSWSRREFPARCGAFDRSAWLTLRTWPWASKRARR